MTEAEWWYVKEGQRHGPVSLADLTSKLISGELSTRSQVWTAGLSAWNTASDVELLADVLKRCPPPMAEEEEDAAGVTTMGLPIEQLNALVGGTSVPTKRDLWGRFFARQLDILILASVAAFGLGAIFPKLFAGNSIFENAAVSNIVFVPLALLLEVPVLALTGTTIGKWAFGVRIRRADGSQLSAGEIFQRNFNLWIAGLGLGVPFITLFCMLNGYSTARKGRRNSWDEKPLHVVHQSSIGQPRFTAGIVVFLALFVGLTFLGTMGKTGAYSTAVNAPVGCCRFG
jgi:hypothetical protein